MGRDVGRDEGREQAEWRDLVARLEVQAPIDPAEAPWPDRENLRTKTQPGSVSSTTGSGLTGQAPDRDGRPGDSTPGDSTRGDSTPGDTTQLDEGPEPATSSDTAPGDPDDADADHGRRGSADRGRVIRPAGSARVGWPDAPAAGSDADVDQEQQGSATTDEQAALGEQALNGPRDYQLDEPSDDDLDEAWDDRYIPPPLPPQPGLDPVAKGAWLALFGGPGYLLLATLLGWQIAGWAALTAVVAFVAGFVVLVFRLGDGPSKRDGPDQGAVV